METGNAESTKAMANVLAGMVDEDNASYLADAIYVLNSIRSGVVPGVIVVQDNR